MSSKQKDTPNFDADVIVVGGGLAGLTAARNLINSGKKVLLLEARDRLGGRTNSVKIRDHWFDLGGQWFGETQKKALALVKELNLTLVQQYMTGNNVLEVNEKRVLYEGIIPWKLPSSIPGIPAILTLLDMDLVMKRMDSLSKQVPLGAPWTAEKAAEWDSISLGTWEQQNCWTAEAKQMLDIHVKEVSFLYFLWVLHSGGGDLTLMSESHAGGAQEFRVAEGAQALSDGLGKIIGHQNIKFNQPVRRIEQNEFGVKIQTDSATFRAKYVICAIAPTLAGRIVYSPPMPALRDVATQRMPMGCVIKTLTVYEKPWWRLKGLNGVMATTKKDIENPILVAFDDCEDTGKVCILVGFIIGERARIWSERTPDERKAAITKQYARLFESSEALNPIEYHEKNWLEEEYSRGCYLGVMPPGSFYTCAKALRENVGRIYWSGTETAEVWSGYMDGAIESGERSAAAVLKQLGK